jgi:hypothetical protein
VKAEESGVEEEVAINALKQSNKFLNVITQFNQQCFIFSIWKS